ncbi:MAG: hypothetical protein P8P30_05845 [Rickettsiales bacterium]|nr:hypothetical protein [Rickettsiales bacterium]
MSDTKKISPAEEKNTEDETPQTVRTSVSPFGAVFLSLLTLAAVLSGAFAFRDTLLPYLHHYLALPEIKTTSLTPPHGFVPIPAMAEMPSLDTANSKKFASLKAAQTQLAAQMNELMTNAPQTVVSDNAEMTEVLRSTQTKLAESMARISTLEAKLQETHSLTTALTNKPNTPAVPLDIRGLVAFQNLQAKALGGQPFQDSLQRVIALLDDSAPIEDTIGKLEQVAPTGRPTLSQLQDSFEIAVSNYMQSGKAEDASFMGQLKQNLSSFVRVRRTDGSGSLDDALITTAETALTKGNIKTAYTELLKLESDAFKTWLPQARKYYQLPEWLDVVQLQLANSLEASQ